MQARIFVIGCLIATWGSSIYLRNSGDDLVKRVAKHVIPTEYERSDIDAVRRFRTRQGQSVVYFVHLKKAGGTTLCSSMDASGAGVRGNRSCNCELVTSPTCGPDARAYGDFEQQQDLFSELTTGGRRVEFFGMEHPMSPHFNTSTERPWVYATAIRHPYDMYNSHIAHNVNYFRKSGYTAQQISELSATSYAARLASHSFRENLLMDTHRESVPGHIIFSLTGITRTDDIQSIATATSLKNTTQLATMTRDEIMALLLETTKERLRHFSAILVRETYDQDLRVFFQNLGVTNFTIDSSRSSNNTLRSVKDEDFYQGDVQVQAALYQKFKYDVELYEYAVELAKHINVIV